ncbi:MAG: MarC family protein [Rhabdochlamydiaceae bacterium]|nr:MarC family protein [Candidatus Amphrikana amoebophyrae]
MDLTEFASLTISLFFLMDPLGNIPLYISTLKHLDKKKQKIIITRELLIALFVIYLFAYLGEKILNVFNISQSTLGIAGGLVLFIIAIQMIFPPSKETIPKHEKDPLIVPLAIPYVAGPSILAAVMIFSNRVSNNLTLGLSIFTAWIFGFLILIFSPSIQKLLTPKGVQACERLMGLILTLIAVQLFMEGIAEFALDCHRKI